MIAVPIPSEHMADGVSTASAIEAALEEASQLDISGSVLY